MSSLSSDLTCNSELDMNRTVCKKVMFLVKFTLESFENTFIFILQTYSTLQKPNTEKFKTAKIDLLYVSNSNVISNVRFSL